MNSFTLPPCPNWYEPGAAECAPDNTYLYASLGDLVVLQPTPENESVDVKILYKVHRDRVESIAINPSWGDPEKLAVTTGRDKFVRVFDVQKMEEKVSHGGHTTKNAKVVGAVFCGDDHIVSVSEAGYIILWKMVDNQLIVINNLLTLKDKVSCLSACPHQHGIVAFGYRKGTIMVLDLKKKCFLYKFMRHHSLVLNLSWCPVPYNVLAKPPTLEAISAVPVAEVSANPAEETSEILAEETSANPAEETSANPAEETSEILAEGASAILDKETSAISIEGASAIIDEETSAISTEGSSAIFDEETLAISTEGASANLDEETSAISSEEASAISNEETSAISSEEASVKNSETLNEMYLTEMIRDLNLNFKQEEDKFKVEAKDLEKEYLLASSAQGDYFIYIYRVLTNGAVQSIIKLPKKPVQLSKYGRPKTDYDNWITVCWVKPFTILTTSAKNELLQWSWNKTTYEGFDKYRLLHNEHKTHVFSIKAPIRIFKIFEPSEQISNVSSAWTFSKDRQIINVRLLPTCEILVAYPTIVGQINVISTSPINPCRMAIGLSEDTCRVIDLSNSNLKVILMESFEKLKHKVSALAWHPKNELILAYGTCDGQVGVVDAYQLFKAANAYVHYRNAQVSTMDWGPMQEDIKELGLYTVISGELIMYNPNNPLAYPKVVLDKKNFITCVAWKPDFEMCAVSNKFGHVSLYNSKFEPLTTAYIQNKLVRSLVWHPECTAEDEDISLCSSWLAACSNEVVVYDFSQVKSGESVEQLEKKITVVAKFSAYGKGVISCAWSSHENGKLAAITDISFITVWDVKMKKVIASIKANPFSGFTCLIWSPLHSNFIISGGKGTTLRYWNISDNLSDVMGKKILPLNTETNNANEGDSINNDVTEKVRDSSKSTKHKVKFVLSALALSQNTSNISEMTRVARNMFQLKCGTNKKIDEKIEEKSVDIVKLFGSKDDVLDILTMEAEYHSKRKSVDAVNHISLWKGDLEDLIVKAINTNTVTMWHVSMAPIVSHQFWRNTCEAYSRKLAKDNSNNSIEAANYYLACNRLTEAINVLCDNNKYREALALAKARMVPEDLRITDVLERWALFSEGCGSFEVAAQCHIAMGNYSNALKALIRRTTEDRESLQFLIELAEHCNENEIRDSLLMKLADTAEPVVVEEEKKLLTRVELEQQLVEKMELKDDVLAAAAAYNNRTSTMQDILKERLDINDIMVEKEETNGGASNFETNENQHQVDQSVMEEIHCQHVQIEEIPDTPSEDKGDASEDALVTNLPKSDDDLKNSKTDILKIKASCSTNL